MRVIAGRARGHKLTAPEGFEARPTADRIKEAVFSAMGDSIYNADFLDLYSGAGGIGIEALSRGCAFCAMMELLPAHCDIIRMNVAHVEKALGHMKYLLLNKDASDIAAYQALSDLKSGFDLIYMDPPYGKGLVERSLWAIANTGLLKPAGTIIVEQSVNDSPPAVPPFQIEKEKKYGKTKIYFLKYTEEC